MKSLICIGLALAALGTAPAFSQIRTPYNSYPATPAERAETAALNRQAGQDSWAANDYAAQYPDDYARRLQQYHRQMREYRQAERRYHDELRFRHEARRERLYRSAAAHEFIREHEVDAGIVGQQIQVLSGDYAGKVVGVDRDAIHEIQGLYVRLDGGKVVWIDVGDVRYDSPYGVIYTDLNWAALSHRADERS
jgi:hypothetical protein